MNRSYVTAALADIDETMARVRDLSCEPHSRAAALQCLADARSHLAAAAARQVEREPHSYPPGSLASVNQPTRESAREAFRSARRILADAKCI